MRAIPLAFKPHPSAAATQVARLHEVARSWGVRLAVADEQERADVCGTSAAASNSSWVHLYGVADGSAHLRLVGGAPRHGIDVGLTPFHSSNRIPVTLVDALVRISPRRRLRRFVRRSRRALGRQSLGGQPKSAVDDISDSSPTKINAALSRRVAQWCPGSRQDVQKANRRYPRA